MSDPKPDTALDLWREFIEKLDDKPWFATELQGGLVCYFCGMPSPN